MAPLSYNELICWQSNHVIKNIWHMYLTQSKSNAEQVCLHIQHLIGIKKRATIFDVQTGNQNYLSTTWTTLPRWQHSNTFLKYSLWLSTITQLWTSHKHFYSAESPHDIRKMSLLFEFSHPQLLEVFIRGSVQQCYVIAWCSWMQQDTQWSQMATLRYTLAHKIDASFDWSWL